MNLIWLGGTFLSVNLKSFFPFRRPKCNEQGELTNGLSFFFTVAYLDWDDIVWFKVNWWSLLVSPSSSVSSLSSVSFTDGFIPTYNDILEFFILACAINNADTGLVYCCNANDGYNWVKVSWWVCQFKIPEIDISPFQTNYLFLKIGDTSDGDKLDGDNLCLSFSMATISAIFLDSAYFLCIVFLQYIDTQQIVTYLNNDV